ncbi:MAG: LysM peptidoglycan-binding domain-containing protein [Lachnospiraceae bacterium]|nr:LysM peptidoglycan-binding domain-containing protein [Lachnospiraceae bacterium]
MAIGYLTIQTRVANDAIPLEGIQIRILDDQGRRVYDLTTDSNGETPMVSLETVDASLSLNPNYTGTPYVGYNVLVQDEGFRAIYIEGVPIYDGESAILPITLIPLQELARSTEVTRITIEKPAAARREPHFQQAPIDEPRVLRQVVIPKTITVHLGTPASYAANVQVPFLDYVKNVASSEVYPTWPDVALRANIYAIITFVLNRIFTEWYRSQGYDFDITNNTAYDQAYVYGGPIYESINNIVDEIFNEYVKRPGQNAPYFTSFCNGTTVTCSGLSQWGTVTLAQRGLTPLQILRSYYPDDIVIEAANTVSDATSSYPGTPLRIGSTGLDVQTIQTYLNRIRRNYPAIPEITDEIGVFGSSTEAAVKKFQSVFNLGADGIVGKATWYKLSQVYTAVTRLAELDSEGTSIGVGTVPPNAVLSQGSRGNDVLTLQYILNVIAQFYPNIPSVSQDGIFGASTRQAVITFQQMMQLNPDGVVGAATWQALYSIFLGIQANIPSNNPGSDYFEYTVRSGDTLWLIAQRYGTTVDAIKRLNGLTSDTLYIGQVLKIPTSPSPSPSYFEYTVRSGDTLWILAQRYGTTVDAIKSLNGLTSDSLYIGQVLKIPTSSESPSYFEYTVRSGDTLWLLAQRFGTTVDAIKSLNGLTSNELSIGQVLLIPD